MKVHNLVMQCNSLVGFRPPHKIRWMAYTLLPLRGIRQRKAESKVNFTDLSALHRSSLVNVTFSAGKVL